MKSRRVQARSRWQAGAPDGLNAGATRRSRRTVVVLVIVAWAATVWGQTAPPPVDPSAGASFDHGEWDRIVARYVHEGLVDYASLVSNSDDIARLDAYLEALATASVGPLSVYETQAFWINAHNACAVRTVTAHYPLETVRQVTGFFEDSVCTVAGEPISLNAIFNEKLRRAQGDPRLLFALATPTRSGPPLRSEAYRGPDLNSQMADQIHEFIVATTRVDENRREVEVNRLFEWFATDFEVYGGVRAFVSAHLEPAEAEDVRNPDTMLRFTEYDWRLNEIRVAIPSEGSGR